VTALDHARWAHFQKLGLEAAAVEEKADRAAQDAERRRLAALQKVYHATKRNDRGAK
jgi:ribosome biogenesis GTPase